MSIFNQLKENKGTVSSALGKELAREVLEGDPDILEEAIELVSYQVEDKKSKSIRAGAAKTVEKVAEKKPELVAPYLNKLFKAFKAAEPQTRWMVIRIFGFCAPYNETEALKALPHAIEIISAKEGLCIAAAADLYLGELGAISEEYTVQVFPILKKAVNTLIKNEQDWLIEAFTNIGQYLEKKDSDFVRKFALEWADSDRKTTQKRVQKLLKILK